MPVSLEGRKREVIQLLKDYRDWYSAYGGSIGFDSLETRGQYGPAGLIFKGMAFDKKHRHMLEESFYLLEQALTLLKHEEMHLWLLLLGPYTGDPGDPSMVDQWRERGSNLAEHHDLAITKLAEYLQHQDLYIAWPNRMKSRKSTKVDARNEEFYGLYQKLRQEGDTKRRAIQTAAEWCEYSEPRGYEIVRIREGGEPRKRKKA